MQIYIIFALENAGKKRVDRKGAGITAYTRPNPELADITKSFFSHTGHNDRLPALIYP